MTRVLTVIHFPTFGGPHNQALRLEQPLRRRGFDTLVVVPDEPGNAASRLRRGGVEVRVVRLHRLRATLDPRRHAALGLAMLPEISQLRRLIRSEGVDIVQVSGLVNPHAAIAARLEGVPAVWQLLDSRTPRPVAHAAMLFVNRLADVVMSTGRTVAEAHPGYGSMADRLVTYFPPVDVDRFVPSAASRQQVRSEWRVGDDELVVGCVANVNPQKGIVSLVNAFSHARVNQPARLVIVGAEYATHAGYSRLVRSHIRAAGLVEGRDVIFLGDRADVDRLLTGFDIFALASPPRSEGITTSVLEAMSVGLPVVVTDVGGLREAVNSERTGLVASNDSTAFTHALRRLIASSDDREALGRAARDSAVATFGLENCAETHAMAYRLAQLRNSGPS